ncbi:MULTISPECIES: hypothetical protein [unclassified Streptomyces]|uniref:hypothetical protein n=1 Tax=unclassified Streptomyces TaxID=2593676 RepID=UPI000DB958B0|nr:MULTISPECIES: hypothetical protein [unclassified Streptomyces]MYT71189.1 hypothetical protein [Streptomyces sp. SID8367]RAJ69599.1 hypothetical protein K377_07993 [Streptomyces sp. PsTaAH-137]
MSEKRVKVDGQCRCGLAVTYVRDLYGFLHVDAESGRTDKVWRGHQADAATTKDLALGDHFRFFGARDEVYGPVADTMSDYMLHWTQITLGDGRVLHRHAWARVEVTQAAPRCGCGRYFELCEAGCPWPQELEDLWAGRFPATH